MSNEVGTLEQLVRMLLIQEPTVNSLVSDRVHSQHFMSYDDPNMVFPLIILDVDGGKANYGMATQKVKVEVYAYSKNSTSQSKEIYNAVYQKLNCARLSQDSIDMKGYSYELNRPVSGFNTSVKCWFTMGVFYVVTAG
jgi:hypothetical protein